MQLPPEWWPQAAVMLTWPHAQGDWGDALPRVEQVFIDIACAIAAHQPLLISTNDSAAQARVRAQLTEARVDPNRLQIQIAPSNDIWVRDHGPLTVVDKETARLLDFQFNGWGGKYPAAYDNAITRLLHKQGSFGEIDLLSVNTVIEGGAIEVNGNGCLMTTAQCLTLDSRNPGLSEAQLEALFMQWFGCHKVHWLRNGYLAGDDTDGHIDTLARFVAKDCIVYQACDDSSDEHFPALQAMAEELHSFRDAHDQPYRLEALPLPAALYNAQGERLPAGYANFLIINGAVLMPGYADAADCQAADVLANCFPDHEIVIVDCRALVEQYGSLHCATMQLPREVALSNNA